MTSIRRRTLGLVLLVFAISMLAIGLVSYFYAAHEIEETYDASLAQNARLLEGVAQVSLPTGQREALLDSLEAALMRAEQSDKRLAGHRYESKLAFQIWEGERLLLRSVSAPEQPFTDRPPGYTDNRVAGDDWRVYVLDVADSTRRVMVAERSDVRGELTRAVALRTLMPDLIGLPLLALLLWWATGRGLRPLSRLAEAIRHRDPHNLQPLVMHPLPRELDTIVGALNRLLERIRELRVREKRFIADATHELRTPLAVLDLHAQNALAAESAEDRREALTELRTGVARATRLVTQLLTLARLDPDEAQPELRQAHLLHEVREALAELSPLTSENELVLTLEADDRSDWRLQTEPGVIGILVQNLVGNALRHSPRGGHVTVALGVDERLVSICVDDQGPGIPIEERKRVTERFRRAGPGAGAGLGLSIVERLLARHGGQLMLQEAPGGGLRVVATLPRSLDRQAPAQP
ncbi:two-component sensor histidine kinase [Billgrantia diversa]|uniref:ATP-binding protein n=1 Tax=Halomonas sp. MCCC 1A13316 TaxID=2733487 RepID=UPI0018A3FBF7|nr:ATP-binding protein [Halomonas sp. MCCC 1A13316]QOR38054.1 two-component sensor histidine kinase [Halomonas sp. MCCC 1A13316]